jgi:hypothetical protein
VVDKLITDIAEQALFNSIASLKTKEYVPSSFFLLPTPKDCTRRESSGAVKTAFSWIIVFPQLPRTRVTQNLAVYVAEDQGPRPGMEDRYSVDLFANEKLGIEVCYPALASLSHASFFSFNGPFCFTDMKKKEKNSI